MTDLNASLSNDLPKVCQVKETIDIPMTAHYNARNITETDKKLQIH